MLAQAQARRQTLLLAYLGEGEMSAGFGIGTPGSMWLRPGRAGGLSPKLRRVLQDATDAGHAYLGVEGALMPVDRVAAGRRSIPISTGGAGINSAGRRQL